VAITVLERFGLPVLLLGVVLVFSALRPDTFFTTGNLQSILSTQSVLAVVAIGAVVPLVSGQFDLSLPAVLGLTQIVAAALMSYHGTPFILAALIAVGIGTAIGLVNGFVVSELGVNSIITTLGTASLVTGLTTWATNGATVSSGLAPDLLTFGASNWLGIPRVFYVVVVVAFVVAYVLTQTPVGRSLEAIGTNARAARLVGLPERRLTILAFAIAGTIAGLAGVLQVAAAGSASPTFGPNLLLPMLSAVFLGATTIRPGQYSVTGTLLAVAFLAASLSGLTLMGAADYVEPIYQGCALIGAVAISTVVRRRRAGF